MRKRLTIAARCAIVMRSKEGNIQEAIVHLRKDLLNGPLHCFGYHTKCSTDFCKRAQQPPAPALPTEDTTSNVSTLPHSTPASLPDDITPSNTSQQSTEHGNVCEAMLEQAEFWHDTMDENFK